MKDYFSNMRILCLVFLLSADFTRASSNSECIDGCDCSTIRGMVTLRCPESETLDKLPDGISNNTEILFFYNNQIDELPQNLSHVLPKLKKIDLRKNNLKVLHSRTFSNLKNLTNLLLSNNEITKLGSYLFEGSEARSMEIRLTSNLISTIDPQAFHGVTPNAEILLSKNALTWLHVDTFADTRNLLWLDLSSNRIASFHPNIFRNVAKLFHLKLNDNELRNLDKNLFRNMYNLETLDLSSNKLRELPRNIFENNQQLINLDLRRNQLETLPSGLPKSIKAELRDNPIRCDCELKHRTLIEEGFSTQFEDFHKIICFNDNENRTTTKFLATLNCVTTTTPTTTTAAPPINIDTTLPNAPIIIRTNTTRTIIYDNTQEDKKGTSWPIVLGVLLGILVLVVVAGLFVYLYRRRIHDKIIEGTLTLTRQRKKKKLARVDSCDDEFKYCDAAGWNGASTAMFKQTEGNV